MSAISYQINRACRNNPDSGSCSFLYTAAYILVIIITLSLPYLLYQILKSERFKNSHWTKKLTTFSLSLFGTLVLIFWSSVILSGAVDNNPPFPEYIFYPLIGILPEIIKERKKIFNYRNFMNIWLKP